MMMTTPTSSSTSNWKLVSCFLYVALTIVYCAILYNYDSFDSGDNSVRRFLSATTSSDEHKDLFPLDNSDWWGTILMTLGLLVAASGGIGGGGILVPLFILVFQFKPRYAIPLSNFCILASSMTNVSINIPLRHPTANRPLVDWDLVLVMEPLTMAGAVSLPFLLLFPL